MEPPPSAADSRVEETLRLFFDCQPLTITSPALRPKAGAFSTGADWREYEGDFGCDPTAASPLVPGTFLWGAHRLGTQAVHLFRVIITGQSPGQGGGSPTRCTFVAVGPFRVIPPHLPLAEVVTLEQAVRSRRNDPEALESYRAWCLNHGWVSRAAELGSPGFASNQ